MPQFPQHSFMIKPEKISNSQHENSQQVETQPVCFMIPTHRGGGGNDDVYPFPSHFVFLIVIYHSKFLIPGCDNCRYEPAIEAQL